MSLSPLPPEKRPLHRAWNLARGSLFTAFLFVTLIAGNASQMLSVLVLRPFSARAFRWFNRNMADQWWGMCDRLGQTIYRIRFTITGDDLPVQENAIVVANHQQMTDIPAIFHIARKKKRLGDLKWYVKDIIKYVPGVGWGMLFLDCLFIKRDWAEDKEGIEAVFRKVHTHKIPLWIINFVEGTRFSEKKVKKSQAFAQERNLPVLHHLLTPRTKGFVATVEGLRGHASAVYDFTIGYKEGVPTLWHWISGRVREVHLHVRRFRMEDLPEAREQLADWLHRLYAEKDQLLEQYRNGVFPAHLAAPVPVVRDREPLV